MLTGAVIKAKEVLFPFGKMEIREKKKKKPWEEENPYERRAAFHRGVHKSWKRGQVLGAEEGWQGNRGSNKTENLRSQSAEWNNGEHISTLWAAFGAARICLKHPILHRPSVPFRKNSKNLILFFLFTGWRWWGRGWGLWFVCCCSWAVQGRGEMWLWRVIGDQTNMKCTPMGRKHEVLRLQCPSWGSFWGVKLGRLCKYCGLIKWTFPEGFPSAVSF